jgi:hypothetical protein
MKRILLVGLFFLSSYAALGQGEFLFNTHDPTFPPVGNDVRFLVSSGNSANFASGPDLFVEVLAGPDQSHLTPLTPILPLNQPGAAAGYTNPFSQVFTTEMPAGTKAFVAYRMFEGASWNTSVAGAEVSTILGFPTPLTPISVVLTAPPSPPNEVLIGTGTIVVPVPELSSCTLGLIALALLFFFGHSNDSTRGHQRSSQSCRRLAILR